MRMADGALPQVSKGGRTGVCEYEKTLPAEAGRGRVVLYGG